MSDANDQSPIPRPAPAPHPVAPVSGSSRIAPGLAVLALAAALGAAAYAWYRVATQVDAMAELGERQAQHSSELVALAQRHDALRLDIDALQRRLGDVGGVNQSLREEVLGIGQRAKLLEDAVARLADRQLGGAELMRLNEVEFLLRLGQERLALFRDPDAAVIALTLADAELAAIEEPIFAGVRQTLAAEIDSVAATPRFDRAALLAELDAAAETLAALAPPTGLTAAPGPAAADASAWTRMRQTLSQYVRVRRVGGADGAPQVLLDFEAQRTAIAVALLEARAAIARGDGVALRAAVARAESGLAASFGAEAEATAGVRHTLERARTAPLDAPLPPLGRTLEELRNLRATRSVANFDAAPERAAGGGG